MKRKIIRLLTLGVILCLLAVGMTLQADAASASIWFTDPTVTVGSNVSIVIDVKGDDIGGYEANISYDTAYLQFVSASGSSGNFSHVSNTGVVRIVDYMSSGSASKMSCTLTFKTKKTGTTKLTPAGCVFTSGGGDTIAPYAVGDSTVKIIPVPEASSDATLKSLVLGSGTLTPAFSSSVTQYSASVDFSVSSLAVTALKNHNGASVYVSGNEALNVGTNTVSVYVTAENGAKQTYTITVTRGKNPLSSEVFLTVGEGMSAEICNTVDPGKVPKGFTLTEITVNNVTVGAISYDERSNPAVYLLGNDKVSEGFYYIDVANMTAKPLERVGQTASELLMLDVKLAEIPEGYELGKYTFSGVEREVLIPSYTETPNHCLVYAVGYSGEKMLYMYDPIENTFQRFGFAVMGVPETTAPIETEEPDTTPEMTENEEQAPETDREEKAGLFSNSIFKWIFIVIAGLVILLAIVGVILGIKQR